MKNHTFYTINAIYDLLIHKDILVGITYKKVDLKVAKQGL